MFDIKCVNKLYFQNEDPEKFTKDGWFKTGDVVSIDPEGWIQITDRTKDVIKSGGEWISSIEVEVLLFFFIKT